MIMHAEGSNMILGGVRVRQSTSPAAHRATHLDQVFIPRLACLRLHSAGFEENGDLVTRKITGGIVVPSPLPHLNFP